MTAKYETVTRTLSAAKVKPGDMATYCGETFYVASVTTDEVSGLLKFATYGRFPQYVDPQREVTVQRVEQVKPYVVLTRRYLKSGKCIKGRHAFATAKQQSAFMDRTTAAVTYYTL